MRPSGMASPGGQGIGGLRGYGGGCISFCLCHPGPATGTGTKITTGCGDRTSCNAGDNDRRTAAVAVARKANPVEC